MSWTEFASSSNTIGSDVFQIKLFSQEVLSPFTLKLVDTPVIKVGGTGLFSWYQPKSLTFNVLNNSFAEFCRDIKDNEIRIEVSKNGSLLFVGYLVSSTARHRIYNGEEVVTITANDGISQLKKQVIAGNFLTQTIQLNELLYHLLRYTNLSLPIEVYSNMMLEGNYSDLMLLKVKNIQSAFQKTSVMSYHDALKSVIEALGWQLVQCDGKWILNDLYSVLLSQTVVPGYLIDSETTYSNISRNVTGSLISANSAIINTVRSYVVDQPGQVITSSTLEYSDTDKSYQFPLDVSGDDLEINYSISEHNFEFRYYDVDPNGGSPIVTDENRRWPSTNVSLAEFFGERIAATRKRKLNAIEITTKPGSELSEIDVHVFDMNTSTDRLFWILKKETELFTGISRAQLVEAAIEVTAGNTITIPSDNVVATPHFLRGTLSVWDITNSTGWMHTPKLKLSWTNLNLLLTDGSEIVFTDANFTEEATGLSGMSAMWYVYYERSENPTNGLYTLVISRSTYDAENSDHVLIANFSAGQDFNIIPSQVHVPTAPGVLTVNRPVGTVLATATVHGDQTASDATSISITAATESSPIGSQISIRDANFTLAAPLLIDDTTITIEQSDVDLIDGDTVFILIDPRITGGGSSGESLYTWVKYADSSSGYGMSDSPTGKEYIGFAYNKSTSTESTTASDYQWFKFKGDTGSSGASAIVQYSSTSTGNNISYTPDPSIHLYIRFYNPSTGEWSDFLRWRGYDGEPGEDGSIGNYIDYIFTANESQPSTPSGANPSGWSNTPPNASTFIWMSKATRSGDTGLLLSSWSAPVRISGEKGDSGTKGDFVDYIFISAASQPSTPTGANPSGWSDSPSTSGINWMSKATKSYTGLLLTAWTTPVRVTGEDGLDGEDGATTEIRFKESATSLANDGRSYARYPSGWSLAAPSNPSNPVWMIHTLINPNNTLKNAWSVPIRWIQLTVEFSGDPTSATTRPSGDGLASGDILIDNRSGNWPGTSIPYSGTKYKWSGSQWEVLFAVVNGTSIVIQNIVVAKLFAQNIVVGNNLSVYNSHVAIDATGIKSGLLQLCKLVYPAGAPGQEPTLQNIGKIEAVASDMLFPGVHIMSYGGNDVYIDSPLRTEGYKSADGTSGYTGTIPYNRGVVVKDGIVVGLS